MGQDNFAMQIRSAYPHLTKAEKKVADFILEKPSEVLYMSITDLADACCVGETTVFRFCKSMKLQGYQEFKIHLSLSIQKGDKDKGQETLTENVSIEDTFNVVTQKLLNSNVNVLMETQSLLDYDKIERLLNRMMQAQRIFFFGVGASQIMAMMSANKFLRITNKVYCYTDSHMQTMVASTLTAEDLAIVISYSGSTKDSILLAKLAKNSGAYVAVITRFAKSPLTNHSDVVLLCGANEGPLQGGSTTAVMSQMFIMEVIYIEYYRRTYDSSYEYNQKTSQSIIDKMY
ncbi:MurR/RpiR family transcriptional regulator [Faecalicatena sp. AGMB00832]|uniref:MurR/RpiR family transcriptional regulator n=1 Tax=Faecalicatena faecalis TaxID=2726362 RepID=A0ABS6D6N0_9FIRM|nr:MurR/RpiR family transcriptional regulator [Faecalicatena faecalis]MBU3877139.1 MurR/RpiR family transcriptional regulator [Faecalicatena faecalis]